jgi:hypothetical protein
LQVYPAAQSVAAVHVERHATPLESQRYGEHAFVPAVAQLPAPSQYAVSFATPAAHVGALQVVEVPGGAPHAVRIEPSQVA